MNPNASEINIARGKSEEKRVFRPSGSVNEEGQKSSVSLLRPYVRKTEGRLLSLLHAPKPRRGQFAEHGRTKRVKRCGNDRPLYQVSLSAREDHTYLAPQVIPVQIQTEFIIYIETAPGNPSGFPKDCRSKEQRAGPAQKNLG